MGRTIDVRSFGAHGDGVTLNTEAIQNAINDLEQGDTLVFSSGCFVTGTIALKSNMTLRIEQDAEICASRNLAHYRDCGFYHNEFHETISLIYALDADHVTITGGGKIQLSGDAFMDFSSLRLPAEIDRETVTQEQIEQTVVKPLKRPTQPIFFNGCHDVKIEGIQVFNSPSWTFVFSNCEDVTVDRVYIDNHVRIPNNDGLHFSASRNITVKNSILLGADDCFAATCITNWDSVCENIEIRDCLMSCRSAAIRFGHLSSHVRNAKVQNVKIIRSNRGFAIFAGENGHVKNIRVENVKSDTRIFSGFWWGKGEGFVLCADQSNGIISDVTFSNCSFTEESPSVIAGMNENISDVCLKSCSFSKAEGSAHLYYSGKLDLQPNIKQLIKAPFAEWIPLYVQENSCKNLLIQD